MCRIPSSVISKVPLIELDPPEVFAYYCRTGAAQVLF
jgi:hypothetical protein